MFRICFWVIILVAFSSLSDANKKRDQIGNKLKSIWLTNYDKPLNNARNAISTRMMQRKADQKSEPLHLKSKLKYAFRFDEQSNPILPPQHNTAPLDNKYSPNRFFFYVSDKKKILPLVRINESNEQKRVSSKRLGSLWPLRGRKSTILNRNGLAFGNFKKSDSKEDQDKFNSDFDLAESYERTSTDELSKYKLIVTYEPEVIGFSYENEDQDLTPDEYNAQFGEDEFYQGDQNSNLQNSEIQKLNLSKNSEDEENNSNLRNSERQRLKQKANEGKFINESLEALLGPDSVTTPYYTNNLDLDDETAPAYRWRKPGAWFFVKEPNKENVLMRNKLRAAPVANQTQKLLRFLWPEKNERPTNSLAREWMGKEPKQSPGSLFTSETRKLNTFNKVDLPSFPLIPSKKSEVLNKIRSTWFRKNLSEEQNINKDDPTIMVEYEPAAVDNNGAKYIQGTQIDENLKKIKHDSGLRKSGRKLVKHVNKSRVYKSIELFDKYLRLLNKVRM